MRYENFVKHSWFSELNLQGKDFKDIPEEVFEKKSALLIKGCNPVNLFKKYEKYALKFGKALEYDNKNYRTLAGTSKQAEIEYHTDGVSCLDPLKIPKYLFFLVSI